MRFPTFLKLATLAVALASSCRSSPHPSVPVAFSVEADSEFKQSLQSQILQQGLSVEVVYAKQLSRTLDVFALSFSTEAYEREHPGLEVRMTLEIASGCVAYVGVLQQTNRSPTITPADLERDLDELLGKAERCDGTYPIKA